MVIRLRLHSQEIFSSYYRLSSLLTMINVVEKFLEIRNKTEQTTGDDKHLELLSALKLKRLIVLVKLNWPQGKR